MIGPGQLPSPSPGGLTCGTATVPCPVFIEGAEDDLVGSFGVGLLLVVMLLTALVTAQLRRS